MPTIYSTTSHRRYFRDFRGITAFWKDRESKETYVIDWSSDLDDGEAITGSVWYLDGQSGTDNGVNGQTVSVTINSGTNAILKNVITTATKKLVKRIRLIEVED